MRAGQKSTGKAIYAAAVLFLTALAAGCNSQGPGAADSGAAPASTTAATDSATSAAPTAAAGKASRCQPVQGGPAPIAGELARYAIELQKQNQSGLLDDNDFYAATQDVQAVNDEMARQNFDAACALADALKANYGLGQ